MFVYNEVYICGKKQQQRDRFSTHTIAASKTRGKQLVYLGGRVVTGFTAFFTQLARIYWLSTKNTVLS